MKLFFETECEEFPVTNVYLRRQRDNDIELDVPDELAERWLRIQDEYIDMQTELFAFLEKR